MKKLTVLTFCILQFAICNHQLNAQSLQWAFGLGDTLDDVGISNDIDVSGNMYVTGLSWGAIPFPGDTISGGFLAKYDASGNYLWATNVASSLEIICRVKADGFGNVYVIGHFNGTTYFNSGSDSLISSGGDDIFISKYDASGNFIRAIGIGGSNDERGCWISTDTWGNIYVTGFFQDTVDFTGLGDTIVSASGTDIFVAKYDSSGNYIWAIGLKGADGGDVSNALETDAAGNIYITGYFRGTIDFDPGVGPADLTAVDDSTDIFIAKYDSAGNYIWAQKVGGTDDDKAYCMTLDNYGSLFISGSFTGAVDFDPGLGTDTLISSGATDHFLAKYDTSGNYHWAISFDNLNYLYVGDMIANDDSGNVYFTGGLSGTADFDPGAGTNILTTAGSDDIFIAKYDSLGNHISAINIGGISSDVGLGITLDATNNIYITGGFSETVDFDPGAGTNYLTSTGDYDFYIAKYSQSMPPPQAKVFIPDTNFRAFLNATYPTFMDGSGDSLLIDSAATLTGTLNCGAQNIADLTGVEYFVNITNLFCHNNQLTVLPALDNLTSLQILYCYLNQLTALPAFTNNTALQVLYCYDNQLSALPDLTNNTALQDLRCYYNQLTTLPDLTNNTALQTLSCSNNQLTVLPDLTNNTALQYITCYWNQLTTLPDLTNNTALQQLRCDNNQLTALPDLTNNTALQQLYCHYNQLTTLPDLASNTALEWLYCDNNKLDFSDARELRIADTISTLIVYSYSPQNPFGVADTFNLNVGDTLILSIASQDSALSYQWFRGTDTIAGATDTLLVIPNVTLADSGVYTCRSYGTALDSPPMTFGPGISEFVSEPFTVNILSGVLTASIFYVKNASCNGAQDGEAAVTATGGTPPYTYQWDDLLTQTTDTAINLFAGNYSVIVMDSAGAADTAFVTITEPFVLTVSITGTDVSLCGGSNGEADLTVTGGTQPYTFNWLSGETTEDLAGLTAGTYQVTVTDSNFCFVIDSVIINAPPAQTTDIIGIDESSCQSYDGVAFLTVTGGTEPYTYSWSNGATTQSLTGLTYGNYVVTVTDSIGCIVTDSVYINGFEPPTTTIGGIDVSVCGASDGVAILTVSGGTEPYTYLWSNGATTQNLISIPAGMYIATVTDDNGCIVNNVITIGGPAGTTITITWTDESACGANDGSATVSASGGIEPYVYEWSNGSSDSTATGLSAGIYSVTVTDDAGCIATDSVTISELNPLSLTISITNATCDVADGSAFVDVSGGTEPYSYQWSSGDTTATADSLVSGIYIVTVTDANGCAHFALAAISDDGASSINVDLITDVSCNGGSDGAIDISVSGGTPPYEYDWSDGSTTEDISELVAGPYELNVTDANGCAVTQSITITEPEALLLTISTTDAGCGTPTATATVNVAGGTSPYTYQWDVNAGNQTTATATSLAAGVYVVTITDENGCSETPSINVAVSDSGGAVIVIDLVMNATCGGNEGAIFITASGGATPYTYLWSDGSTSEDLTNALEGVYDVTVTDSLGCIVTASVEISMVQSPVNPICIVTVDSTTGTNLLVWEKEVAAGIESYNIYKESTYAGLYYLIGNVPYDSLSIFEDSLSNPQQRSWRYKISVLDSCGNESELSEEHKTMHLTINQGLTNINLIWDHYEGFTFGTYYIYRYLPSPGWEEIVALPNNLTSYTDDPPSMGNLRYQIIIVKADTCYPSIAKTQSGPYSQSLSNIDESLMAGSGPALSGQDLPFDVLIYPNPNTGEFTLVMLIPQTQDIVLKITNMLGQQVYSEVLNKIKGHYQKQIDLSQYPKGIYNLQVVSDRAIFNKKLIIE